MTPARAATARIYVLLSQIHVMCREQVETYALASRLLRSGVEGANGRHFYEEERRMDVGEETCELDAM